MQTTLKEIEQLSKKLNDAYNPSGITVVLEEFLPSVSIYIYDSTSESLREFTKSWISIDEIYSKDKAKKIYSIFEKLQNENIISDDEKHYYGLYRGQKVVGILEFVGKLDKSAMEFLNVASFLISLKIQNIILSDRMQKNIDFHDAMKNIAKIIETQYELNYIVPLIGEMLDRFISDHLIYVFLKQGNEFKLVWPKACKDERIYETLKQLTPETNYILTSDDKIGAFPLTSDGEITGCIVARSTLDKLSKRDISYLEQLTRQSAITINRANTYSKVLQYATLDALTNLNNRRQFEVRLKQEIATTKRQKNPLCAMMVDIDFFKKVNDTYGHASGDAVLRTVASIIKEHLRESDIPSRYGGEEFAVLLPYTHIEEAKIVGERLRKAVETTPIPIDKKNINVTISMGLAEFSPQETGEDLFKRADSALYEAKESGRNRVCVDLSVNH